MSNSGKLGPQRAIIRGVRTLIPLVFVVSVGGLVLAACGGDGAPPPTDAPALQATVEAAVAATTEAQAAITTPVATVVVASTPPPPPSPPAPLPPPSTPTAPATAMADPSNPFASASPEVEQCAGLGDDRFARLREGTVTPTQNDLDRLNQCSPTTAAAVPIATPLSAPLPNPTPVPAADALASPTTAPAIETAAPRRWPTQAILRAARSAECAPGVTTDYSGVVLQRTGIDYSGQDLRGADFEGQILTCDNFAGANLQGANLTYADLAYINFEGADLRDADLSFASTWVTNLTDVIWGNTRCFDSSITHEEGAAPADRISECKPGIQSPRGGQFFSEDRSQDCPLGTGEDLGGRDLSGADLEGRDLSCADLSYADLSSANLRGANLSGALLWGTNLRDADLNSATFRHAWLGGAKFHSSLLRNANFDDTDLFFTDLTGADLTGATIQNVVWGFETHCGDGGYPWRAGATFERPTGLECPGTQPVGPPASLPDDYPGAAGVMGGVGNRGLDIAPVQTFAVWDQCPHLITEAEVTPFILACVKSYIDAGINYLSYTTLEVVETGSSGWAGIKADYPELASDGLSMNFDGNINMPAPSPGHVVVPSFSNSSDAWLDFFIGMLKTQVDAGMTGIGIDAGWGSFRPAHQGDFSPAAMEGFREYLEGRYSAEQLLAKGISDISTFNWVEEIRNTPVFVDTDFAPGGDLTSAWWQERLGRPLKQGETYTSETFRQAYGGPTRNWIPLFRLIEADYEYYQRMRLQEIYTRIRDEIKPYAAANGQPWYLSGNIYNDLGSGNAAVGATIMDLPMGEISAREQQWLKWNFTSFFKNMAALGKRYISMTWPGQVLTPSNNPDTEAQLIFLADVYATGGVSEHPTRGPAFFSDVADPFYQLIQAHENFFAETDNRVALYYSLGNHMGDVDRENVEVNTYYGAARLLEDSHYSYDVLYQGDPDMGPGTVRWVDQQVSLADMQEYQVIVLPHTRHMSDAEVQSFLDFVQNGGILVVFGEAGTHDFAYPTQNQRSNSTWENLVSAAGTHSYGSGTVLVVSDGNIASDYDNSLAPAALATFQAIMEPIYPSDVTTDFSKDVHVHRFSDLAAGLEVFHLVNFEYDAATDKVIATDNKRFAFDPSGSYDQPQVTYYTPESPEGEVLTVTRLASGNLQVTVPRLHVYGAVILGEAE